MTDIVDPTLSAIDSSPAARTMVARRTVLTSGVALGAVAVLGACSSDDPASSDGSATTDDSAATDSPATEPDSAAVLAASADVPVGGGIINADAKVVITQPVAGEFKGFTAICTHQNCTVSSVEAGSIICACHGSKFSAEDGSVQGGPATSPLSEVPVAVDGANVVAG